MTLEGLIKHYRGQNEQQIKELQEHFGRQIPSKEEYVRTLLEENKEKYEDVDLDKVNEYMRRFIKDSLDPHKIESEYPFDNKFITDADKTKKEIWEHAFKLIIAQREKII